jgi:hypothetical protein
MNFQNPNTELLKDKKLFIMTGKKYPKIPF